jgi:glutamate racemase
MLDHPATRMIAAEYLSELTNGGIESLILGCTHYPLLAPLIRSLVGAGVTLVDPGAEAARATARLLEAKGRLGGTDRPDHRFFLSDQPRHFHQIARAFLGRELPPVQLVDQTDLPWFERTHA